MGGLTRQMYLYSASTELLAELEAHVHRPLEVTLEAAAKVTEHGGATRQHHVLRTKDEHKGITRQKETVTRNESKLYTRFLQSASRKTKDLFKIQIWKM